MVTITKIKRLLSAIGISLIAFFELCFTGRARNAWRIARVDAGSGQKPLLGTPLNKKHPLSKGLVCCRLMNEGAGVSFSPPSAPIYLSRVIIILLAIVLMIVGALLCAKRSTGSPFHLEDAHRTIEQQQRAPTEGTSSIIGKADNIKIAGCAVLSILIIGGISLNVLRKESRYGKEGQG